MCISKMISNIYQRIYSCYILAKSRYYWNSYYRNHRENNTPSSFALYSFEKYLRGLTKQETFLELGCGNGRDSFYFAQNSNLIIDALDIESEQIQYLNQKKQYDNVRFQTVDFCKYRKEEYYAYIYSRFTFHSITPYMQNILLNLIYNNLKPGGYFFLEVRSVKDEMLANSKRCGSKTEGFTDHYRCFCDYKELIHQINKIGLTVIESVEDTNLAVYKNENPCVIRIIAQKQK